MKRIGLSLYILTYFVLAGTAQMPQPLPSVLKGFNPGSVFSPNPATGFVFKGGSALDKAATFNVKQDTGKPPVFTAEVFSASSNHFGVQSTWRSGAPIEKGDVLLARITTRSIYARQESGDAVIYFFMQQALSPFERNALIEMRVGPEWKTFEIPFVALNDLDSGAASIGITFGALSQKVEIADMQVLNFQQKAMLAQMPATPFSYSGREENAAWRKAALQRIGQIRTAPIVIKATDKNGKPVKGVKVSARLIDPEFIFGTAASARLISGADSASIIYKSYLLELFNAVTLDNNLKWPSWRNLQQRETTKAAIKWIEDKGLRLRGHNLVWPGSKFTPAFFSKQTNFGPSFADSIAAHIEDIATYTKGKVYGWDVINEMMHEKDYFKVMPRSQAVEWFKQARRIDPDAALFINEYGMLNNIASPQNIKEYISIIEELRNGGAPIDAIGVQGHVGRQPRNPTEVLTDLDLFNVTGLPVQITEFDVNSPDELLQADYTRDFLIACYSHPGVTGFTMWGFWEPAHWKPDAAMLRKDWTAKPNLQVWRDLVLKEWRTTFSMTSDRNGDVKSRGHLGLYEITVTNGKSTIKQLYKLTKGAPAAAVKL
ncbi:MAG: endo-1,4-beta-xylanase [Chitinophagaceae bacterium]|nr:endo-1,4-beta-xylanase [Chitinophagaceae bacterium]